MEKMQVAENINDAGSSRVNASNTYLNFILCNDSYGMEVAQIREVIEYSEISNMTRIPMVHELILGVINLRGEIVPIVDLSMRMYNTSINVKQESCVIIMDIRETDEIVTIGAMVDKVNGVINIPDKDLNAIPDFGAKISNEFIECMGKADNEFVTVLNISKLLSTDELSDIAAIEIDLEKILTLRAADEESHSIASDLEGKISNKNKTGDIHNFVTLAVGQEFYAIDIKNIHEITHVSQMSSLPNSLPFMKGIINLRGKIIPVVDLRTRCGLEEKAFTKKTFILVVKANDFLIGLVAETVLNIVKFPIDKVQHPLHYSAKISTDFIEGLIQLTDRVLILLDVLKILSPEEFSIIKSKDFSKQE